MKIINYISRNYSYLYLISLMRYSQQREAIRDIVCGTRLHPTADWVYNKAKKQIPNISLGTVYRNLGQLVEHQIICAYTISGFVRYDGNITEHHHFICDNCNAIQDIKIRDENLLSKFKIHTDNIIVSYQMKFRGTCFDCSNEKKTK